MASSSSNSTDHPAWRLDLPRLTRAQLAALLILMLLAIALRIAAMRLPGLRPDQMWSVEVAQLPWRALLDACAQDTHPPFYYALLKVWYLFFPKTLASAQVMTAILTGAGVGIVFWLARGLFGTPAAWLAAGFAAATPYLVFWGHVPRNHQLQPLACALIVGASYRYLAGFTIAPRPLTRTWWLLAAAWMLALQTNYMAFVIGLVWGVAFMFLEPAPLRARLWLAASTVPGLISFIPWLAIVRAQMAAGPAKHTFFQDQVSPIYLYFNSIFGAPVAYQPGSQGLRYLLSLIVFTLIVVLGARAVGRRWSFWWLLLALPTLPILLAKCCTFTLANRHLAYALPLFLAYWGACLARLGGLFRALARQRRGG